LHGSTVVTAWTVFIVLVLAINVFFIVLVGIKVAVRRHVTGYRWIVRGSVPIGTS
jgi:hypothetical protein